MQASRARLRRRGLRLAALASALFAGAEALILPATWPLMPFPQEAPVEVALLLGFLFGFLVRRAWVVALPITALAVLHPQSGFAGSLIALLVVWPFAAAGGMAGVLLARWLRRRMLRRALRAAMRPERAVAPGTRAGRAARDELEVASAGR